MRVVSAECGLRLLLLADVLIGSTACASRSVDSSAARVVVGVYATLADGKGAAMTVSNPANRKMTKGQCEHFRRSPRFHDILVSSVPQVTIAKIDKTQCVYIFNDPH
ncbi:hypothetical protein ACSBOB_30105 [Mesorhizobium sp. ASY16-5R]|uniref:hypothetical protein n=1 Tax=Mesorhizobium sp. ASY16-5R TaxID=3445772 RepID=UPI003FA10C98